IRWHHERFDGTGYPDRLRGNEIPLSAQVVGIADVYDALTTARAYRPAFSHAAALAEIARSRGLWSGAVYGAFLASLPQPHASQAGAPATQARPVRLRLTAQSLAAHGTSRRPPARGILSVMPTAAPPSRRSP